MPEVQSPTRNVVRTLNTIFSCNIFLSLLVRSMQELCTLLYIYTAHAGINGSAIHQRLLQTSQTEQTFLNKLLKYI